MKPTHAILLFLAPFAFAACAANGQLTPNEDQRATADMPSMEDIIASGGKADLWDDLAICHYVCRETRPYRSGCFDQHECASFCGEHATTLRSRALVAYVECALDIRFATRRWSRACGTASSATSSPTTLRSTPTASTSTRDPRSTPSSTASTMGGSASAVVEDGSFQLSWDVSDRSLSHLVLYYVDRDNDGVCTPGVDVTGSDDVSIGGDWLEPYYYATFQPDISTSNPGWECEYIND